MCRAYSAVLKKRPIGSRGIAPVKNSQSTARLSANSAAEPAKTSRITSASPQIPRTIDPGATNVPALTGSVDGALVDTAVAEPQNFTAKDTKGMPGNSQCFGELKNARSVESLSPKNRKPYETAPSLMPVR